MNIVLLGAPGSGKGTLAGRLKAHYGIPHISTGDIVRAEINTRSTFGMQMAEFTKQGLLLPDTPECMGELLLRAQARLREPDCSRGFVLDGIPRTGWQTREVDRLLAGINRRLDVAILLQITEQTIVTRLAGRIICKACAITYPATASECNQCHQPLVRRRDDSPEVVTKRVGIYQQTIGPVLKYYADQHRVGVTRFITIDGTGSPDQVFEEVISRLYPRDYLQDKIPAYPSPRGYSFFNLVEMYKDPGLIRYIVASFANHIENLGCDYVAAPEARALPIFGALTYHLGKPGVFLRKAGKLPDKAARLSAEYKTAYSADTLEMNADSNLEGKRIVILDDGISSGGTILAAIHLMETAGATVVAIVAVVRYHYREVEAEYRPWESKTLTLFDLRTTDLILPEH